MSRAPSKKAQSNKKSKPTPIDPALPRCQWVGISDAEYLRYHDEEWGVPQTDSRKLFEKMVLEGFQSGLSWLTILKKRENFRKAFHNFDVKRIAKYTDKDIARLMDDAGIVRNRAKILATIANAQAFMALEKHTPFAAFIWDSLDAGPIINRPKVSADVPAQSDVSVALSKALKKEGFRFIGPTTAYAFMQSVGMVNDHLASCHRHAPCAKLQKSLPRSKDGKVLL